ncbi:MAG: hypothetical protein QOJ99_1929 [Bryobacterales bacterium]|nr:hypothetical protein [Bryobacterales bacterium]
MRTDEGEAGGRKTGVSSNRCAEHLVIIDEICACVGKLDTLSTGIRKAVEQNDPGGLAVLKQEFDRIREQIIKQARRLALCRAEHGC